MNQPDKGIDVNQLSPIHEGIPSAVNEKVAVADVPSQADS